jgi:hypothetical protein
MVLRFACGDVTVVAGPATTKHLGVIHSPNRRPARQTVAVLALRGGTDVIGWWCRGLYEAAAIVAPGTRTWRALENAHDMAAFAIHISMCAVERPAGGEMIKAGTGCGLRVRLTETQGENCQTGGDQQRTQSLPARHVRALLH